MINNTKHIEKIKENQIFKQEKNINIKSNILCPKSKSSLKSSLCFKCNFCQIFERHHTSGRSLTSLICLYNQQEGYEEK